MSLPDSWRCVGGGATTSTDLGHKQQQQRQLHEWSAFILTVGAMGNMGHLYSDYPVIWHLRTTESWESTTRTYNLRLNRAPRYHYAISHEISFPLLVVIPIRLTPDVIRRVVFALEVI